MRLSRWVSMLCFAAVLGPERGAAAMRGDEGLSGGEGWRHGEEEHGGGETDHRQGPRGRLLLRLDQALHEPALHGDDHHDRRQQGHHRRGHDDVPFRQL